MNWLLQTFFIGIALTLLGVAAQVPAKVISSIFNAKNDL